MKKTINYFGFLLLMLVTAASSAQTNIYTSDGALKDNRTVEQRGSYLNIVEDKKSNLFVSDPKYHGFVGVNTTTPSERLQVVGTVKAEKGIMRYSPANGTTYSSFPNKIKDCLVLSAGTPISDGGSDAGTFNYMDFPSNSTDTPYPVIWMEMMDRKVNTRFRFFAKQESDSQFSLHDKAGQEFFMLTEDGLGKATMLLTQPNSFLGIGTSTFVDGADTYRLSVKGAIRADRVRVYTTWADYVFEKEYKLPTLEEVEKHIQENGHLKDIPSAKEVEANGIELGEMNKKLLLKVEELTLYIIEMNKELQEVKSQIKKN